MKFALFVTLLLFSFSSAFAVAGDTYERPAVSNRSILITSPSGGEVFTTGQKIMIAWSITGDQNVSVHLGDGRNFRADIFSIPNDGSVKQYEWTIPAGIETGDYEIVFRKPDPNNPNGVIVVGVSQRFRINGTGGTTPPPSGQAPTITSVTAPPSVAVGTTGQWLVTVSASSAGGQLSVNWGDGTPSTVVSFSAAGGQIPVTHAYSELGSKSITFKLLSPSGAELPGGWFGGVWVDLGTSSPEVKVKNALGATVTTKVRKTKKTISIKLTAEKGKTLPANAKVLIESPTGTVQF